MTDAAPIADWSAPQKDAFLEAPIRFEHSLPSTGLFEDEALIRVLDAWPDELYDINLFDFDAEGNAVLRTGVRGRLPGREVLAGIKEGRVWVQLRRADKHYPELGRAIRDVFAAIGRQAPGFRPVAINAQLILSAPQAKVPFHADARGVILFHMRGRKRLWVYPPDEAHLPQASMEDIALKQTTEDLPYRRTMDANAQVFDLEPGQALSWPLQAPHRVENLSGFNVSVSVDYQTWTSRILNGAHYTNGLLRRWGLPVAPIRKTPAFARAVLWAASLLLSRLPLVEDRIAAFERTFELDGVPRKAA